MNRRTFFVLTFLISAVVLVAHAQSSGCTNYYVSGIAAPSGYGTAYDLFSTTHELEVFVDCSGSSPFLKVGSGLSSQYVYKSGYLYSNGWQPISLTGNNLAANAWYPGAASAALSGENTSQWTYVVGYVCAWNGSAWLCGCADTTCSTNYWQLQAFVAQTSAGGGTSNGGSNGSGAGGQWGGTADANAIVIAPNGSDSNPCNVNSPCQSLGKAQQMARSASDKTIYLRAGTYNIGGTISLTGSDSGETWMTYPGDAVNSAVIDGGNTVSPFALNGVSNFTWNGIKVQNCASTCFVTPGSPRMNAVTIENGEFAHVGAVNCVEGVACAAIVLDNCTNCVYSHNYVHDLNGFGIELMAFNAGDSIDGGLITGNVVTEFCKTQSDCGGIYTNMRGSQNSGGSFTESNNFVRDGGSASLTNDVEGIYLDDYTSHGTVIGNVIGPACAGCLNTGNRNLSSAIINNTNGAGSYNAANTYKDNLIDLGSSAMEQIAVLGGSNDTFTNNVIIANFAGALQTCSSVCGVGFMEDSTGGTGITIASNAYVNYGGGASFSNGSRQGDASPVNLTAAQLGCSSYVYNFTSNSAAFNAPVNFPPMKGGWGPPGFVIPSSTNHSDP